MNITEARMLDVTEPDAIEVEVNRDGTIVWVHVNGVTLLRACRIGLLYVTDHRDRELIERDEIDQIQRDHARHQHHDEVKGKVDTEALIVGAKYKIRYKSTTQRVSHWAVMRYLGPDEGPLAEHEPGTVWDLRPLGGTQRLPGSWLISVEKVDDSEPVCINKTWKE